MVRNVHPAIQYLLLEARRRFTPDRDLPGRTVPAPESIDLPLSSYAHQYTKRAAVPPAASAFLVGGAGRQLLVLLIPVLAVLYPLLQFFPRYTVGLWRRVFRLYNELKRVEDQLISRDAQENPADLIARLDRLEERASRFRLPVSFRPLLYALRLHIALVRQRLQGP